MKHKYRDKTRIMYEILRYLSKKESGTKDEIVRKINVSYSTLVRYIYGLEECGAIQTIYTLERRTGRYQNRIKATTYKITEKGRQILEKMRALYEMLGETT